MQIYSLAGREALKKPACQLLRGDFGAHTATILGVFDLTMDRNGSLICGSRDDKITKLLRKEKSEMVIYLQYIQNHYS